MQFKYNWDNFKEIKSLLTRIYQNTLDNLEENDKHYANQFINDLEDFIKCVIEYRYDLNKVISALKNIECISFQKPFYKDESGIFKINFSNSPKVIIEKGKILLSRRISASNKLDIKEMQRLYLYHGLCHFVLNFQNEDTLNFSKIYHEILKDIPSVSEIETTVNSGWLLLEESLSQEIAESFVYYLSNKNRPGLSYGVEGNDHLIIEGSKILSDHHSYRMFQPILIMFGWALNNVGSPLNHSYYMIKHGIVRRAINRNFSSGIISEYIIKKQGLELFQLLYMMGLLVNAKYKNSGINLIKGVSTTKEDNDKLFEGITVLARKLATLEEKEYDENIPINETMGNDITKIKILLLVRNKRPYLSKK